MSEQLFPKIVYYVAMSLDGYIATPEGGVDWLAPFENSGEDYGYGDFYASVDGLIMGRRTYDQCLAFGAWPYAGKPCWVVSTRQIRPAAADVHLTAASPREIATAAAGRRLNHVWLVGGASLASSFRAHNLITDYIVSIVPVVLGGGVPLIQPESPRERLTLTQTKAFATGVVQLHYRAESAKGS